MKAPLQRIFLSLLLLLSFCINGNAALKWPDSSSKKVRRDPWEATTTATTPARSLATTLRGGWWLIPPGWHPFGYKITELGEEFLAFDGSVDSDLGRFLASVKSRKTLSSLKENWTEVVRVAKTAQAMRILRQLEDLIAFCLRAHLID